MSGNDPAGTHTAPFPIELPTRLIEMLSPRGGLILDPFAGSGTTILAARKLGRHSVGFETQGGQVNAARNRLAGAHA